MAEPAYEPYAYGRKLLRPSFVQHDACVLGKHAAQR